MGKRIKFMGISHEHSLMQGDDFGGQLSEGLPQTIVFDRSNNWIVDAEETGLSDSAIEVLLNTSEFKDVSDMERIPLNRNQTTFLGMKDGDSVTAPGGEAVEEDLQYAAPEDPDEEAKRAAVAAEKAKVDAEAAAAQGTKPKR